MTQDEDDRAAQTKAVKVIGGHKAQITRALAILEKVIAAGVIAEGDITAVKSAKLMVDKQITKIEAQMDSLLGNDYFTGEDLNTLTDYVLEKLNVLEQIVILLEPKAEAAAVKADGSMLDASVAALSESLLQVQSRQLSQSDLPTFNGEQSEYIPFIESFNYLVHENESIPDVLKANYLKKCMTERGPSGNVNTAYDLLKYISPTADNYTLMRAKLEKRFKLGYSSRGIYITNLRKLSTWKPCHSPAQLRKLYDYITENLELLKLAGGSDINESDILLADVMSIIPSFIVNDYIKLPGPERSLTKLLDNIDVAVGRMFEKDMFVPKTNNSTNTNHNRYTNNNRHTNNSNSRSNNNSYSYQAAETVRCMFCTGDHSAFGCNAGSVQDRLHTAQEQRVCHNCLRTGHYSGYCRYDRYCKCGRGPAHCRALCMRDNQAGPSAQFSNAGRGRGNNSSRGARGKFPPRGRGGANGNFVALPADPDPDTANNALADSECFMEIATGYVQSATTNDDVAVRFLLDTGSNASFGEKKKVMQLRCEKVGARGINVATLGGNVVKGQDCDIVKLMVKDKKNYSPPTEICISLLDLEKEMVQNVQTWPLTTHQSQRIRSYELSDEEQVSGKILPIDILIGLDHYWKFMHKRTEDPGFGPLLRSSKLGWILSGQRDYTNPRLLTSHSKNPLTHSVQSLFINSVSMEGCMSDKLENESVFFASKSLQSECTDEEEYNATFSDLETFGIKPDQEVSPVLADFNNTIKFNEDTKRYSVQLPLIEKFLTKLDDGYQVSKVRLDSLFSKIRNPEHSEFANQYYSIIEEQERLGVIERVSDISHTGTNNVCYIPHHGVFKKGSDKMRIVYDGSFKASQNKVNLNDCLSPGPSLTNELIEMLMRFRTHDVVLIADITKAFLMMEVFKAHRDYLRFLWYDSNDELVIYRFKRVPFGLTSSSFLLNATLRYHMQQRCLEGGNPDLLALLGKSHYVDDWIVGAKTPEDVIYIKNWLTEFLEAIGMTLHKFNSNSEVVRESIGADCPEMDSVLGLLWNNTSDLVTVNVERAVKGRSEVATKKELYSAPPRVFDPLGFLQPFMFQAKLLFQEASKLKLKWKDKLPTNIREKFEHWINQLPILAQITVPRQVLLPRYDVVELHGFGDASKLGYCAVVYMVSRNSTVSISRFIVSKTRVAPLKEMSIPRLELTAAFLLARVMALVIKFHDSLSFAKLVYYSDSTTALHWIHSDHRQWTTYVANRSRDINLLSSPDNWKFVKGEQNPADLGTRGIDADELVGNDFWMQGPTILRHG